MTLRMTIFGSGCKSYHLLARDECSLVEKGREVMVLPRLGLSAVLAFVARDELAGVRSGTKP
eukprot:scaffold663422_cov57-Prasinocladus_malaysianus.AAC.1